MKLKIVTGLSNKDYHKDDGFYSSSVVKAALNGTQAFHNYLKKRAEGNDPTPAMQFGTASHTCILENEKFKDEVISFDPDERPDPSKTFAATVNKVWKANIEDNAKANDQLILAKSDVENILRMREIVMSYPFYQDLIERNSPEVSFYIEDWVIKGHEDLGPINIKVRPDILMQGLLADYKTFGKKPTADQFTWQIKEMGYDVSMALYKDVLEQFDQFKDLKCFWMVQNSQGSGDLNWIDANDWIELGRAKYIKALRIIKEYKAGNIVTMMDDLQEGEATICSPTKWDLEEYGLE